MRIPPLRVRGGQEGLLSFRVTPPSPLILKRGNLLFSLADILPSQMTDVILLLLTLNFLFQILSRDIPAAKTKSQ